MSVPAYVGLRVVARYDLNVNTGKPRRYVEHRTITKIVSRGIYVQRRSSPYSPLFYSWGWANWATLNGDVVVKPRKARRGNTTKRKPATKRRTNRAVR